MNSIKLYDYIKLHQSWPGTICKVCGKEDRGPYYEIYKKGRWTLAEYPFTRSSYGYEWLVCKR